MSQHILLLENDVEIRELLVAFFYRNNWQIICAHSREEVFALVTHYQPIAIILDINIFHEDTYTICRCLRECTLSPIIITSNQTDIDGRIRGLEAGANDYIIKPYNPVNLLEKLMALTKAEAISSADGHSLLLNRYNCKEFRFSNWSFRPERFYLVSPETVILPLSIGEYWILIVLLLHPQCYLSSGKLLAMVKSELPSITYEVLVTHIERLKYKLGLSSDGREIIKISASGYLFAVAIETIK